MKLEFFIPENLLKIPIISQMKVIWDLYTPDPVTTSLSEEEFNGIKSFIESCINDGSGDIVSSEEDQINIINYLTKLFYCVKGTPKVFEYMKDYLGIRFESDPVYKDFSISMKITEVSTLSIDEYFKSFCKFIRELLYYYELTVIIDTINLVITKDLTSSLGATAVLYKEFNITEEG